MRRITVSVAAVVIAVAVGASTAAKPGSGASQGAGSGPSLPREDRAAGVAIQRDGRIVVAGSSAAADGLSSEFALARYLRSGRPDEGFGAGGKRLSKVGAANYAQATSVALQADGKVVVAGWSSGGPPVELSSPSEFALERYLRNGTLDRSFGDGGKVMTGFGPQTSAKVFSVAQQADGKIVAAGSTGAGFTLVRYLPTGDPDPSFGSGGIVTTAFGPPADGGSARASAVAIQKDGKVVAVGASWSANEASDVAVVRYTSNGRLDASFGDGGKARTDFGPSWAEASALAIQGDGKIVAAGSSYNGVSTDVAIARYLQDGSPDPTFGAGGKVVNDLGEPRASASAVAIQRDGGILVVGDRGGPPRTYTMFARFLPDGTLDQSFRPGGSDFGSFPTGFAAGVSIRADGKIVVGGSALTSSRWDFGLGRYLPDGRLDAGFGNRGVTTTDLTPVTWVGSVSAARTRLGVRVLWRTQAEVDTRGFNVYRQASGAPRRRANPRLIPARGSVEGGASYSFLDRRATRLSRRYWVQEVKRDGTRRLFGPATARP